MSTILLMITLLAAGHGVSSEVCSRKLDLIIAIDGSSSICESESCPEWRYILQFIKNLVASFNIGPDNTRVSLLTISSQGNLTWNFDEYLDQNSLLSAIDRVVHPGGEMDSIFSANNIVTGLVTKATSQRSDATTMTIGITDGVPRIDTVLGIAASTALQALGMNAFAVCVTDRCPADLIKSASSPPKQINVTYFLVKDYSSIDNAREELVKQVCSFKGTTSLLGSVIGVVSSLLGF